MEDVKKCQVIKHAGRNAGLLMHIVEVSINCNCTEKGARGGGVTMNNSVKTSAQYAVTFRNPAMVGCIKNRREYTVSHLLGQYALMCNTD